VAVISHQLLGSPAASIAFSSIPATYRQLLLVLMGRLDGAVVDAGVTVTFNSDTANNYDWTEMYWYTGVGGGAVGGTNAGVASLTIGNLPGASAPSGAAGMIDLSIPSYYGTTFHKVATARAGDRWGTSSQTVAQFFGSWRSTAAINALTLTSSSGNFIAGTEATLYGIT
jgi:hypothetical protein